MNSEEQDPRDHLVDMLLCELVSEETPPDLRSRVLHAIDNSPRPLAVRKKAIRKPARVRPARPSKAPALLAVAAVVTLLVGAGSFFYFEQASAARTPMVSAISGTANFSTGSVKPGIPLTTGSDSNAQLTFQDGTIVKLDAETTMVVPNQSPWTRSKLIEIVSGRILADVSPQPDGLPMTLISEDAKAEVVGTKLSFQRSDGVSRLEVTEGAVRFVPQSGEPAVLVKSGLFAESGKSGFRSGQVSAPSIRGITRFTLMNAETDRPIRSKALIDGETISLASLPTQEINIRADFEGTPPESMTIRVSHSDGGPTGLPAHVANPQKHPPFFAAGDYWTDGRPNDCRPWTPRPGLYRISATAVYAENEKGYRRSVELEFRIIE